MTLSVYLCAWVQLLRLAVARVWTDLVWIGFFTALQHKKAISARGTVKLYLVYIKSNYFVSCIKSVDAV
jgi:hypothetical protein